MMSNNIYRILLFSVLSIAFASCTLEPVEDLKNGDSVLSFEPTVAEMSHDAGVPEVRSSEIKSEDGSINLMLGCKVTDGICCSAKENESLTKGTLYNREDIEKIDTFKVIGWNPDGSLYIPETTVKYQSEKGKKRWLIDGENPVWANAEVKTFFAYTNLPEGATVTCNNESQEFTYSALPANAADQKDVLLGYYKGDGDKDNDGFTDGVAAINFIHPMTSVVFKLGELTIIDAIKSISLEGVYQGGMATVEYKKGGPSIGWEISTKDSKILKQTVTGKSSEPFILFPQNLSEDKVLVEIVVSSNFGDLLFSQELNTGSWDAGKTYTYSLNYNGKVDIPDSNFNTFCLANFDTDRNGEISMIEAAAVTEMKIKDVNGMENLCGIEYFPNLEHLECALDYDDSETDEFGVVHFYNEEGTEIFGLKTLDVSHNPKLKYLDCAANRLETIDISHNTALEVFLSENNYFTSIDVSRNTSLKEFACCMSKVESIDVSNNIELTYLDTDGTQLKDGLDVSKNVNLIKLSCIDSGLTSLYLGNNTKIEQLDCDMNYLTTLNVTMLYELNDFSCSENQLSELDVSKNTKLDYFNCSANNLTVLDVSNNLALNNLVCDPMPSLATLYVSKSQSRLGWEVPETTDIIPKD